MRVDSQGRNVTDLYGLHDESDTILLTREEIEEMVDRDKIHSNPRLTRVSATLKHQAERIDALEAQLREAQERAEAAERGAATAKQREALLSMKVNELPGHFADYSDDITLWSERAYKAGVGDEHGWCVEYTAHRKFHDRYWGTGDTLGEATRNAIASAKAALAGEGGDGK